MSLWFSLILSQFKISRTNSLFFTLQLETTPVISLQDWIQRPHRQTQLMMDKYRHLHLHNKKSKGNCWSFLFFHNDRYFHFWYFCIQYVIILGFLFCSFFGKKRIYFWIYFYAKNTNHLLNLKLQLFNLIYLFYKYQLITIH